MLSLARPTQFIAVFVAITVVPVIGCGDSKKKEEEASLTIVKGKLVDNGRPFALDQSRVPLPKGAHGVPPGTTTSSALQVIFMSTDTKEQYIANANAEAGTFEVLGNSGKGIKPGRYRIAVVGRFGMGPGMPDYFQDKFSTEKTQILRDIKAGDEVVIDVSKPQG